MFQGQSFQKFFESVFSSFCHNKTVLKIWLKDIMYLRVLQPSYTLYLEILKSYPKSENFLNYFSGGWLIIKMAVGG